MPSASVSSMAAEIADETRSARNLAALSFAVTVIAVGVPVWLKTTEIYRASIPYDGIARLQQLPLEVTSGARLQVVAPTAAAAAALAEGLRGHLQGVDVGSRPETAAETAALAAAADPWAADDALSAAAGGDALGLRVVVLSGRAAAAAPAPVLLGRHAAVLVTPAAEPAPLAAALRQAALGGVSEAVATRRVHAAPEYDLLLSAVVPEPTSAGPVWDAPEIRRLLAPAIAALRPIANISIKTQHLYHAGLGVRPTEDPATGEHYLTEEQLSLVITPLEARLGAAVSGRHTLHFVVYVPPERERPLRLRPPGGADAFLVPRWGGVQIFNPPSAGVDAGKAANATEVANGRVEPATVDSVSAATVIVTQLRLLLGIPEPPADAAVRPPGAAGVRGWELAALRRRRTRENVDSARRNLASLAAMLGQISNIVIDDAVGAAVDEGVREAEAALRLLEQGADAEAYASSCRAFAHSERAIFDPSMLALLYFPDDQKYAIYIPLFLPVSIPVLMSLQGLWAWARGARGKVKAE